MVAVDPRGGAAAKDQPFYHLLAENAETEYVAYVSEQNLLPDTWGRPCDTPPSPRCSCATMPAPTTCAIAPRTERTWSREGLQTGPAGPPWWAPATADAVGRPRRHVLRARLATAALRAPRRNWSRIALSRPAPGAAPRRAGPGLRWREEFRSPAAGSPYLTRSATRRGIRLRCGSPSRCRRSTDAGSASRPSRGRSRGRQNTSASPPRSMAGR